MFRTAAVVAIWIWHLGHRDGPDIHTKDLQSEDGLHTICSAGYVGSINTTGEHVVNLSCVGSCDLATVLMAR